MILFESDRLDFREWTPEDWEAGLRVWGDHEVMKFVEPALDKAGVLNCIAHGKSHMIKYKIQHWAVVLKKTQEIIGACGFNVCEDPLNLEMVFHFSQASWGNGYATEAGLAAINYLQTWSQAKKLEASVHLENKASKQVLLKLGFTYLEDEWFEDTQDYESVYERTLHL